MSFPTVPVLAGVGLAAYFFRDKIMGLFAKGYNPSGAPAGYVSTLDQNRVYIASAVMSPSGGIDTQIGSQHLKAYLTTSGFQVLTEPVLKSADEALKYSKGLPATWIAQVKWTRPEKYVTGPADPAVSMVMFTPIPAAA